jgi:hypothetical protein
MNLPRASYEVLGNAVLLILLHSFAAYVFALYLTLRLHSPLRALPSFTCPFLSNNPPHVHFLRL